MANKLIKKTDDLPNEGELAVSKGDNLRLELAFFSSSPDGSISLHMPKDSHLQVYVSDFSVNDNHMNMEVELEEGASAEIRIAVLSSGKAKKTFTPNVEHIGPSSEALVSCYGIAADESDLSFKGLSSVNKGCKKSNTRQEAKIILFDEKAKGAASPALVIAENDIKAGHGASIGRLNDEHLFYLESRGLSEKAAKRLIVLGYLKPIAKYYSDEKIKEKIDLAIEGGISHA